MRVTKVTSVKMPSITRPKGTRPRVLGSTYRQAGGSGGQCPGYFYLDQLDTSKAYIHSTVKVKQVGSGTERAFTLVAESESDIKTGKDAA